MVICLGVAQIFAWGTSFYFPAVLAAPIVADTAWPLGGVVGGVSIGLLVGGLVSPRVGRAIERYGGRPVLILSSLLFAAGLSGIALAPSLWVYLLAWAVVGLGMGTGLYDAVFAALGMIYGKDARAPITNLTLFGGFASTVCWPLGAALVDAYGWRTTSLVYAAIHLAIALPLQLAAIPRAASHAATVHPRGGATPEKAASPRSGLPPAQRTQFTLLALVLTISSAIGAIVVVHLLIFLQARGVPFAVAVSLGTLFGPSQVGARIIESLFGRHYHPIWTMVASCTLMAVGLLLLLVDLPIVAVAILLYGGGYGIMWIARGTLPLELFGPQRYAGLMGRLALPALIAQALAPSAGAVLLEHSSAEVTVAVLAAFALFNVLLIGLLWAACRPTMRDP
ncbi:MAG: MFS transporter [Rhizobiales bacterium]|nr:MFS transporter [Hyphomicrobiales bacterium]